MAELHSQVADAETKRRHPRTLSPTTCVVKTKAGVHEYTVRNLSVAGALLTEGPPLDKRKRMVVVLKIPLYPEVTVPAKVVDHGVDKQGQAFVEIGFMHQSDRTEDHIQSALLSEIERSQSEGRIADILD